MVEEQTLRTYPIGEQRTIADALLILATIGVYHAQIQANKLRFVDSFNEITDEDLIKQIQQVKQTNRDLLALHEMSLSFRKGIPDA